MLTCSSILGYVLQATKLDLRLNTLHQLNSAPICGLISKFAVLSIWTTLTRAGWSHFHDTLDAGVFHVPNVVLITIWRKIRLISGFRHFPFLSPQPTGCRSGRAFSRGALKSNTMKTITASRKYSHILPFLLIIIYESVIWDKAKEMFILILCTSLHQHIFGTKDSGGRVNFKAEKQPNWSQALITWHKMHTCRCLFELRR